jgi:PAS domain S-box-containing protein
MEPGTPPASPPAAAPPAAVPALAADAGLAPTARRLAVRITTLYLAFGLTWIAVSDTLLEALISTTGDPLRIFTWVQTIKGWCFVLATGGLLFLIVRHFVRAMEQTQARLQRQLAGVAEQYQRLFDRSPSAMMIYDPASQQILAVNDACLMLYGYARPELLGMRTVQLVAAEERGRAAAAVAAAGQDTAQRTGMWQCRRRDGRVIFVEVVTHQVDFNGRPARIALAIDVTERLQAERSLAQYRTQLEQRVAERTAELSRANDRLRGEVEERHRITEELRAAKTAADAANVSKSTFLANTSHEIRTPLTSILGYADLLADPQLSEGQRGKYLEVLQQNAQHLLSLIDDLLDLSRAEMGKVRVAFGAQSPREIADQAMELLRHRAAEKALAFALDCCDDVPEQFQTDGVRVRQILLNLLSNAIKFTARGKVTLTIRGVRPAGEGGDGAARVLRFEVADTGIGLDEAHVQRVFEPFYQVDQGATRRYGGSGLGLAISRQLAHQIGGSITVTSTLGAGSTFVLELPVAPAAGRAGGGATGGAGEARGGGGRAMTIAGASILLAEDNPNIRLLVDEYLRRAGARVVTVGDGAQAVQRMQAGGAGGGRFDLILLDLHMPHLGGLEAMRQIRAAGYGGPIIGLTADYANKSAAEWAADGWDAMAAKPIDRQAFIPLLADMLARGQKNDGPGMARAVGSVD